MTHIHKKQKQTSPQIYLVGGAVRDQLLGQPIKDRDWLVVGATPEYMLAQGYQPVGKDFPVFLHPKTHEEYALARTERKAGQGYHGFSFYTHPTVSLEDDLKRRDFTVNAMAMDTEGNLYDPYHGQKDLKNRIFRHVSEAFSEDPLRLLRLARFMARFTDFTIAPETVIACHNIVASGELQYLSKERVYQEITRALEAKTPERFFETLIQVGAWDSFFTGISWNSLQKIWAYITPPKNKAALYYWGAIALQHQAPITFLKNMRAPKDIIQLTSHAQRVIQIMNQSLQECSISKQAGKLALQADTIYDIIQHGDALRKPEAFKDCMNLLNQLNILDDNIPSILWDTLITKIQTLNIQTCLTQEPKKIPNCIRALRIQAIREWLG